MYQNLSIRSLGPHEVSYNHHMHQKPFILSTPNSQNLNINDVSTQMLEEVKETYQRYGRVMLRGFKSDGPQCFQSLLERLDFDLDGEYLGGASPRSNVTTKVYTSTDAPGPFIISYHTEMCYLNHRPRQLAFYCQQPPPHNGETPIFDCHQIYLNLPLSLSKKLETKQLMYVRYFSSKKSWLNVYKTWQDTFLVENKQQLAEKLKATGLESEWLDDGILKVSCTIPALIKDPVTGKKTISLTLFNKWAFHSNLNRFKDRYFTPLRKAVDWYAMRQYDKPKVFFETLFGDGSQINKEETEQIQQAAWDAATVFKWQQDDILLLDNIRWGHGRLNVIKPRKVIAALGNMYDIREMTLQPHQVET